MLKPNISAFYFFIPLIKKKFVTIIVFFIYIIFATIEIWIITNTNPWLMFTDIFHQAKYFASQGNSLVSILSPLGIPGHYATLLLAGLGTIICLSIFYFYRNYSLLTLLAIASVMGRICFYHRIYDNVMLVFLLLAIIELTFKYPQKLNIIILIIVGTSLWIPGRAVTAINFYQTKLQFIIWGLATVYLLIFQRIAKVKNQNTT